MTEEQVQKFGELLAASDFYSVVRHDANTRKGNVWPGWYVSGLHISLGPVEVIKLDGPSTIKKLEHIVSCYRRAVELLSSLAIIEANTKSTKVCRQCFGSGYWPHPKPCSLCQPEHPLGLTAEDFHQPNQAHKEAEFLDQNNPNDPECFGGSNYTPGITIMSNQEFKEFQAKAEREFDRHFGSRIGKDSCPVQD